MKNLIVLFLLSLPLFAQDFRVGPTLDVSPNTGLKRPRLGMTVGLDTLALRNWLSLTAAGDALWTAKIDGGEGVSWGVEGVARVKTFKGVYAGGGISWNQLTVEQYTKDAYRPLAEAGTYFNLDGRPMLLSVRYLFSGNDVRNHFHGESVLLRIPVSKKFSLEEVVGFNQFHRTDLPNEKLSAMEVRTTFYFHPFSRK